jgi:hypothetical protein
MFHHGLSFTPDLCPVGFVLTFQQTAWCGAAQERHLVTTEKKLA